MDNELLCSFLPAFSIFEEYVRSLKRAFITMVSAFLCGKLFDFILHPVLLAYGADEVTYMETIFPIGNMYLFFDGSCSILCAEKEEGIHCNPGSNGFNQRISEH